MVSVPQCFVACLLLGVCAEIFSSGNYKLRSEGNSVRSGITAEETCFQLRMGFQSIAQKAINKTVCFFYKT
ncbi:hypothetical protein SAMN04515617_11269 [Collimonas sp. OK242]|nr:hypothetical protein SAMN04515617_11269 [Collimonas sp. OK242]